MIKRLLRKLLLKPVLRLSARYSSRPDRERVFGALTKLLDCIRKGKAKKGLVLPFTEWSGKFIVFSDQHKGARNGADDIASCEPAYLAALEQYNRDGYTLIALGDSEELWENGWLSVSKAHAPSFQKEKSFHDRGAFIKIFGNHDLQWANDPLAPVYLRSAYGTEMPVYEGVLLRTETAGGPLDIFCTHGHQGDEASDGNWFSKFFVARIWGPLQSWLAINPNTPAYDSTLKTLHNTLMYEWGAAQPVLLLITGHTHQPVFESLTHIERLYRQLLYARAGNDAAAVAAAEAAIRERKFAYNNVSEDYLKLQPSYFNSGCCCFADGSATGIEIADGQLRLVSWHREGNSAVRTVLEEAGLEELRKGVERVELTPATKVVAQEGMG